MLYYQKPKKELEVGTVMPAKGRVAFDGRRLCLAVLRQGFFYEKRTGVLNRTNEKENGMKLKLTGGRVFQGGAFSLCDMLLSDGRIVRIDSKIDAPDATVFDLGGAFVFPGLTDVHVHLREPGFLYKETVATGTAAAAHGGYTTVCSMPNLSPTPDSPENLAPQLDAIRRDAVIRVLPYGTITVGERGETLSDMAGIADSVVAFSDDGRGVQTPDMMRQAMRTAKALGKIIAAHCEDNSLLFGGVIHDGEYARAHGLPGISSESEWKQVERDLALAAEIGCAYHVCHVSTKESVALIREAKAKGVDVTAETAPHYLILTDADLCDEGRFKMNPPLRSAADRAALLEGVLDGTLDMIATDHAPHSAEEKARGLLGSPMGVTGLELAFPLLYTKLVLPGIMPLSLLIERMAAAPARRFGIPGGEISEGSVADLFVFDPEGETNITDEFFLSKGRATPFLGATLSGKIVMTVAGGRIVYKA
jgi:dihydroorotase